MALGKFTKADIEKARKRVWEGTKKVEFKPIGETLELKIKAREKKALKVYTKWRL